MRTHLKLAFLGTIVLAAGASGCGRKMCGDTLFAADGAAGGAKGAAPGPSYNSGAEAPASSDAASRAIAEADIIQLDGDRLYAMSKSGSVAIVDVANPAALSLLGKATLSGEPFEMYRSGNVLLTMSNSAVDSSGNIRPPVEDGAPGEPPTEASNHDDDGAVVTALDVQDPKKPRPLATFVISGQIADSRMVGHVLYVATYENSACFECGPKPRTLVTSFDVSDPTSIKKVEQLEFSSNAPDSYNLAWGMAWKRSIFVNDQRLYIGGHADFDPYGTISTDTKEGIIDVVDITDPDGHLAAGAHLTLPGAVLSRWQMDETGGVFRVISQRGAGRTGNGVAMPEIDTFTVAGPSAISPLGHATISLPRQEGLRTVRFDGTRAYAITFNQTDPLFALDLADPANPKQRGELQMPGWMFYLEPHGDRVIGLGVDRGDPEGSLNVSLFDVSDMASPTMIKRVSFGAKELGEDYAITNYELPEDQDRIQKAFKTFADGLVVVPFSGTSGFGGSGQNQCESATGGIQLVRWQNDTLTKGALLPMEGNPRRAFEKDAHILAVSDSNVSSFALASVSGTSTTPPAPASDVVIGTCVAKTQPGGGGLGDDGYYGDEGGYPRDGYDGVSGGRGYGEGSYATCE
jgi:hypothetical protein